MKYEIYNSISDQFNFFKDIVIDTNIYKKIDAKFVSLSYNRRMRQIENKFKDITSEYYAVCRRVEKLEIL